MKRFHRCPIFWMMLLSLLLFPACIPEVCGAEAVTFQGVITFNDGTPVSHVYPLKDITAFPLSDDSTVDISNLETRTDSGGTYRLTFRHAGRYELRLWGNPVTEFEVVNTESGLSVSGLSPSIRLSFDQIIQINRHNKKVETVDQKTGQTRTKSVPIDFTGNPEIMIMDPRSGTIRESISAAESLIVPIPPAYAPPNRFVFMISAEGHLPTFTVLSEIPDEKRTSLNFRLRKIAPRKPRFEEKKGRKTFYGKFTVHNVVSETYYWIEAVSTDSKGGKELLLLSYSEKTRKATAEPIRLEDVSFKESSPTLFLNDRGTVMLSLRAPDRSTGEPAKRIYALEGDKGWTETSHPYPLFNFQGRLIDNTRWIVPNWGGIVLPAGGVTIQTTGTVKVCTTDMKSRSNCGRRKVSGEYNLTVRFDRESGDIEFDLPQGACTGSLQGGMEDNRVCVDPDFAPLDRSLSRENEAIAKKLSEMAKEGQKIPDTMTRGVSRSGLIEGTATINGEGPINYVRKRTILLGFNADNTPDIMRNEKGEPVYALYSGLGEPGRSIHLIGGSDDGYRNPTLLNPYEGPYPELRYYVEKDGAPAIVKVYPQNYRWQIIDGEIVPDRSGLFKPGDPNRDSDGDGVTDANDRCPGTPSGTAVNSEGCPLSDYLALVSPATVGDIEIKAGEPLTVQIVAEYQLDSATSGIIRATAETALGTLFLNDFPVKASDSNIIISFPVTLGPDEPVMSVTLQLIPAGISGGPTKTLRYISILGSFTVTADYEGLIAAHPKNEKEVTFTISGADGAPITGRDFTVLTLAQETPWLDGGWITARGRASTEVKTDDRGTVSILYIPPAVLKDHIGRMTDPSLFFPATQRFEIRDRADTQCRATIELPLESPYPVITKFAVPGGDLAGTWQNKASTIVIDDNDSTSFTITLWGRGEFGYSGGHGFDEELEVEVATSPFQFRFRSEEIGLDLNDLPDVMAEFGKTNTKIFKRYMALLGGKKLLKAFWVRGAKAQSFIKTADGMELPYTVENAAKLKDKGFFVVSKMMTPDGTWATKTVDAADCLLGAQKNVREGIDTCGNQLTDQKLALQDETGTESTDVMLDGVHATVGFLDTCQSFADLAKGAPMDPYSEALKILYENAKTFYALHRKFEDVAESWEDVMFIPIMVEVSDGEGHRVTRMAKYAVKYAKKAGEK